jgi:hypothetical protein
LSESNGDFRHLGLMWICMLRHKWDQYDTNPHPR